MADCLQSRQASLAHLEAISRQARRPLRPSRLGPAALEVAIETGIADLQVRSADLRAWQQEIHERTCTDAAVFRGSVLTMRPDLVERFDASESKVNAAIGANRVVGDERRKLQLA